MLINFGSILGIRVSISILEANHGEIVSMMQADKKIEDVKLQFGKSKSCLRMLNYNLVSQNRGC